MCRNSYRCACTEVRARCRVTCVCVSCVQLCECCTDCMYALYLRRLAAERCVSAVRRIRKGKRFMAPFMHHGQPAQTNMHPKLHPNDTVICMRLCAHPGTGTDGPPLVLGWTCSVLQALGATPDARPRDTCTLYLHCTHYRNC